MDSIVEEEDNGAKEEKNSESSSACPRLGEHEDGKSNGFTMTAVASEVVDANEETGPCRCPEDEEAAASVAVRGVLFSRSIRSTYACLHLYPLLEEKSDDDDGDDENHIDDSANKPLLVRLQFVDQESLSALRSHIRRFCKMGDLLCITQPQQQAVAPAAQAESSTTIASNDSMSSSSTLMGGQRQKQQQQQQQDRVIIHITSVLEASRHVKVEQYQYWKMGRVQQVQAAFRQFLVGESSPHYKNSNIKPKKKIMKLTPGGSCSTQEECCCCCCCCCSGHEGGGLEKRKLAQYMANFLVHMTMNQIIKDRLPVDYYSEYTRLDPSQWATTCPWQAAPHELVLAAIEKLNSKRTTTTSSSSSTTKETNACSTNASDVTNGDATTTTSTTDTSAFGGVLDVAGGSGLVSMALGMLFGVRATVVDPRSNVGKLPKRDRKVYQRALSIGHTARRSAKPLTGTDRTDNCEKETYNNNKNNSHNGNDTGGQTTTGAKQPQQQRTTGDVWSSFPLYCQPVQFDTRQAWFGQRLLTATIDDDPHQQQSRAPSTVVGRQPPPNQESDNIEDESDDSLLSSCSAIVALHPDQATDSVVEVALRREIPFVVVPCCVFSRLFPHRRRPTPTVRRTNNGAAVGVEQEQQQQQQQTVADLSVNTRLELLDYLQAKDDRIQRVDMPFIGANTVLWCTF